MLGVLSRLHSLGGLLLMTIAFAVCVGRALDADKHSPGIGHSQQLAAGIGLDVQSPCQPTFSPCY